MSDGQMFSFRVEDPELSAAIEDAAESEGSKSDALRNGLRAGLLGDGDDAESDSGVSVKAREGHRKLVEWAGVGGRIELETAESMLANEMNIGTDGIRRLVVKPLKAKDAIRLHQGVHHVWINVGTIDGEHASVTAEVRARSESSEAATDGGEVREELDELAEAERGDHL